MKRRDKVNYYLDLADVVEGFSLKEIAEKVGFKTPSAVSKRIEKLAGAYEDFISGEYSDFLDKHTS